MFVTFVHCVQTAEDIDTIFFADLVRPFYLVYLARPHLPKWVFQMHSTSHVVFHRSKLVLLL